MFFGQARSQSLRPSRAAPRSWSRSSARASRNCEYRSWPRRRRTSRSRSERWGWRIARTGYTLDTAGLVGVFFALIPGHADSAVADVFFLALLLPGILLSSVGSTVLGIAFVRNGYRPRATAWLLTLALPATVVLPVLLGNNSLGLVPLMLGWGVAGLDLWRAGREAPALARAATDVG